MSDVFSYTWKILEINNPNIYLNSKTNLKIGLLPEEDLKSEFEDFNIKHKESNPIYVNLTNFPL